MTRMPWLKLTCVRASAHNVAASGSMRCSRRVKASWAGARSSSPCTFAASVALTERGEAITKLMLSSSEHLGGFTPFFYYIFFNCVTSRLHQAGRRLRAGDRESRRLVRGFARGHGARLAD